MIPDGSIDEISLVIYRICFVGTLHLLEAIFNTVQISMSLAPEAASK